MLGSFHTRMSTGGRGGKATAADDKPLWMKAAEERLVAQETEKARKKEERKELGKTSRGATRLREAAPFQRQMTQHLEKPEASGLQSSNTLSSVEPIVVAKDPERLRLFKESLQAARQHQDSPHQALELARRNSNAAIVPPLGYVEDDREAAAMAEAEADDRRQAFEARIEATKQRMRASRDRAVASRTAAAEATLASVYERRQQREEGAVDAFLTAPINDDVDYVETTEGTRRAPFHTMSGRFFADIDRLLVNVCEEKEKHRNTLREEHAWLSSLAETHRGQEKKTKNTNALSAHADPERKQPDWVRA